MKTKLNELLKDLQQAYQESDIRKFCLQNNHEWNFSLVTTTLKSNGPLVLGFNWGASKSEDIYLSHR